MFYKRPAILKQTKAFLRVDDDIILNVWTLFMRICEYVQYN